MTEIRLPESVYEQWLVENVETVFGVNARVLARQHRLPSGRIPDLIVQTARGHVLVVEVKARRADITAVGQLLSYVGEFESDIERASVVDGVLVAPELDEQAQYALLAGCGTFLRIDVSIDCRVVGDEHLRAAAAGLERVLLAKHAPSSPGGSHG